MLWLSHIKILGMNFMIKSSAFSVMAGWIAEMFSCYIFFVYIVV